MRLRKKPWIEEALQDYRDIVYAVPPSDIAGHWRAHIGAPGPLWVEIGSGKGQFIAGLAAQHPECNLIGIEQVRDILYYAAQKVRAGELTNVRLLAWNAGDLTAVFAPGEIDCLYLNFSDPWPKARHAKRRLTHHRFLDKYRTLLAADGELRCKTDNHDLFMFSLEEWQRYDWELVDVSMDLHADEPADNIRTEYETKFSAKGQPIYQAIVRPPKGCADDE